MSAGASSVSASSSEVPEYLRYVEELPTSHHEKYEVVRTLEYGGFNRIGEAALAGNPDGPHFAIKSKLTKTDHITHAERVEIHALKKLENEENVVKMVDLIRMPTEFLIIMNLAKTDLHKLLHPAYRPISAEEKRTILYQLFNGLAGIHKNKLIHRDIKPGNVLISNEGIIQITDFGLSVPLVTGEKRTSPGGTLYYKAIELLMDDDEYDEKVDMWAAGCSMAELWLKALLFRPSRISLMDQIRAVSLYCGFPDENVWPRMVTFKHYRQAQFHNSHLLKRNLFIAHAPKITEGDALAADLLLKLVNLYPERRISASDCLTHGYFMQAPVQPHVKSLLQIRWK